jgi:hypothetical protein
VIKLTARSWGRELKRRFPGAGVGGERERERLCTAADDTLKGKRRKRRIKRDLLLR